MKASWYVTRDNTSATVQIAPPRTPQPSIAARLPSHGYRADLILFFELGDRGSNDKREWPCSSRATPPARGTPRDTIWCTTVGDHLEICIQQSDDRIKNCCGDERNATVKEDIVARANLKRESMNFKMSLLLCTIIHHGTAPLAYRFLVTLLAFENRNAGISSAYERPIHAVVKCWGKMGGLTCRDLARPFFCSTDLQLEALCQCRVLDNWILNIEYQNSSVNSISLRQANKNLISLYQRKSSRAYRVRFNL